MVKDHTLSPIHTEALSQDRLRALYQLIQRLNSVYELPELLGFLLEQVLEDTGGRRGYLLLASEPAGDGNGPRLEVKAAAGDGVHEAHVASDVLRFVSRTVVRDVLQRGEPRVIEDLRQDARYKGRSPSAPLKWQSILAVPLKTADQLIGLMYIEHPDRNAFPYPDMEFLSAFAAQAAAAIVRAQQNQRRIEELERLNEVSRSVVRVLDLDEVLVRILREATRMLEVETGSVLLLETTDDGRRTTDELVFRVSVEDGRTVRIAQRLQVGQGVAGWVVQHRQPLLVPDVHSDPRWYGEVEADFASRSILCVPLKIDDHVIGVLQVLNKKGPRGFTDRDQTLLCAFATSATVAIENARLFAEARQARELRALNMQMSYFDEVGSALTASLDLEQVLRIIMEGVTSLVGVERVSIFLIDEASDDLVLEYSADVREDIRLPAPWQGVAGWIASHGQPALVNDVHNDPRFLPDIDAMTRFDTRSILGAPLQLDERTIGVVEALNKLDGPFTEKDQALLLDFGKWAAIALHNARLYRDLKEAKDRLATVEAIAVMGDMALNLTHELSNRISIVPPTIRRIQAKCRDELRNPYLCQKLEVIQRAASQSITIIRRIRTPFEIAEEASVNVADCLSEALSSFELKRDVEVIERYQPGLPLVRANRQKLVEAFGHVVGNALDAIGERGQLLLSARRRMDGLVELVISDDGPGIAPEVQDHVFELGSTTKADKGGLGLGLWWTHAYVSRLGGQVKILSSAGRGTTVSIRLPAGGEGVG